MRKIFTLFIAFVFTQLITAQDSLMIQGINYKVDTVVHKHDVGLGSMLTKYSLPDLPLMVSVLEIDVSNPYVEVVSVLSNDTLRGLEQPSQMAARKSGEGLELFGGVNADFFITSGYDKGLPVNGQILGGQLAKVPSSARPLISFDSNNQPFLDLMSFEGLVTVGEEIRQLNGVNSLRGTDQLILFNQYHGTTTRTNQYGTEVVVSITGGDWKVNQPLNCVVEEVQTGIGSAALPAGKAVLSGHGTAADYLNSLQPNDQIEIEINVGIPEDASATPDLEEMVGGDRIMLDNGLVVDNNWPQLHPRTAAGFSEDKSKVILAVVDGRNNELSIGVSTKQLADIMKLAGAWWAMNLDGGGSSTMVVRDEIINTPSGGYERSVANALFFASTAPTAEAVDFKLNAEHFSIPYGQKANIKASTFNEYGDVVDYLDAPGVTYTIQGDIGTIDGEGVFSASGVIGDGIIIGEWSGATDSVYVTVEPTVDLVLAVKDLTIDHLNTYRFDVYGQDSNGTYYQIDNELISFESSDPSVGEVDSDGVFSGKTDGTVTVRTFIEGTELEDECIVNVEIGRGHRLLDDFSEPSSWSLSKSFIDAVVLSRDVFPGTNEEMLRIDYTMTYAGRTASIILDKYIDVYGMPDSLLLEAAGSGKKNSFILSLDHSHGLCLVPSFTSDELLEHKAPIKTDMIAQEDYPVPFKSIRIAIERDESYVSGETYTGTLFFKSLKAVYPEKEIPSFINKRDPVNDDFLLFPNPARDHLCVKAGKTVESRIVFSILSMSGQVLKNVELDGFSYGRIFPVSLAEIPSGNYLLQILDNNREVLKTEKFFIRK